MELKAAKPQTLLETSEIERGKVLAFTLLMAESRTLATRLGFRLGFILPVSPFLLVSKDEVVLLQETVL